jgi:small subunit ribosomal protein S4
MKFLEARLDNTVFRLGIAKTRSAARQLVSHRHITVNGKVVNISSYALRPGDVVGVREKSKTLETIADSLALSNNKKFNWVNWDGHTMTGTFVSFPERDQIPENIKEQLIVELYSK